MGSFLVGKTAGNVEPSIYIYLVLRFRVCGALSACYLYTFMTWYLGMGATELCNLTIKTLPPPPVVSSLF
jgi:hypothetical protein